MPAGLTAVPEIVLDDAVGIRVGRREQARGRQRAWPTLRLAPLTSVTTGAVSVALTDTQALNWMPSLARS